MLRETVDCEDSIVCVLTVHSNHFNEDFNLDVFAPVPSLYLAISWFVRTIRLIASEIYKKKLGYYH